MQNRSWETKDNAKDRDVMDALGRIVAAYIGRQDMDAKDVGTFIQQIFSTLCNLQNTPSMRTPPQAPIDIEKSITPDYLICLEDKKPLKMLKRHLRTSYGMTPEQYRERWSLPVDYPMVAPNYAKKRSALAKNNGLGLSRRRGAAAAAEAQEAVSQGMQDAHKGAA